ncbi:MAG: Septum formation protein Maf [Opitutia bacterium UBA7350]|nr:MAG: Septum formation protein Maf [Opitutae bacterium UBA7350]
MAPKQLQPAHFILASASPRRQALLRRLGVEFTVQVASVVESECTLRGPEWMVAHNASLKADAVALYAKDAMVLGSDTTVAISGQVLGKPRDLSEARQMLELLSGNAHTVYTAVSLRLQQSGYTHDFVETSEVHFKHLDSATIKEYHLRVDPLDKAGAYGIQAEREMIIDTVVGSVENVMGLPIQALAEIFKELGVESKLSKSD